MADVEAQLSGNITMSGSTTSAITASSQFQAIKLWFENKRTGMKPWSEFLSTNRFSKPNSVAEVSKRLMKNVEVYQTNYFLIFLCLATYCILTSPLLLVGLSLMFGGGYYISIRKQSQQVKVLGHEFGATQQYIFLSLICLPLFFLASAGSTVFWIIGASFFIIMMHASFFGALPSADEDNFELEMVEPGLKFK